MIPMEEHIRKKRDEKEILLISHAVLGFPSFELCRESVSEMSKTGVDIIELQIPFSEPQADGPYLTKTNQQALENGTTVEQCFSFAKEVCQDHPETAFVFMTYYNILFVYGIENFVKRAAEYGIKGIILPDLPIEEADEYLATCKKYNIAPVLMFAPTTTDERMQEIAEHAQGFIYCQARIGVTGSRTTFDDDASAYITRCKAATNLPIAMGFGIQSKEDVDFLKGKVDIAICCTQAVKTLEASGTKAMTDFLQGLRA